MFFLLPLIWCFAGVHKNNINLGLELVFVLFLWCGITCIGHEFMTGLNTFWCNWASSYYMINNTKEYLFPFLFFWTGVMDQVMQFVEPSRQFVKDSIRLVKRCTKPDRKGNTFKMREKIKSAFSKPFIWLIFSCLVTIALLSSIFLLVYFALLLLNSHFFLNFVHFINVFVYVF